MTRFIIANVLSFLGAIFLCLSCLVKTKRGVATCQLIQCGMLAFAQIAFGKGGGAVTMSAAFVRNFLIATGHYTTFMMIIIATFTLGFGITLNSFGVIGLLPVFVGVFYTVAARFSTGVVGLKYALSLLLCVWVIYSVLIFDLFGALSNFLALTLNIITLAKMKKAKKKSPVQ